MILLAGADTDGLGEALESLGADIVRVDGMATKQSLVDAGIEDARAFVLTEMDDASAIPVAKELRPDLRVLTYSRDSLPEFARGQTDLAVDPALLDPEVVAEELLDSLAE